VRPTLVLATSNAGKAREFSEALAPFPVELPAGYVAPRETERDFVGNALLKARRLWQERGGIVLADDSGLEVAALDGRPGVDSAHYAGEPPDPARNIEKLLSELGDARERSARFVCAVAMIYPTGEEAVVVGMVRGSIASAPKGENGFGYDPVFVPEGDSRTFAQMSAAEKEAVSHRGRALRRIRLLLQEFCS
jgi:XTP/dITP diphosphohydrolase